MCYVYDCELFCDNCGAQIVGEFPEGCENSGDTNEYPQYFGDSESDCPEACAGCGEWLGNSLTSDGVEYLIQMVREGEADGRDYSELRDLYNWVDFIEIAECAGCGECSEVDDWGYCTDCDILGDCEPRDGDFTITPCGTLGGKTALARIGTGFIAEFDCDDLAVKYARAVMSDEGWFDAIWQVSDHGNWSLWTD